MEIVPNKILIIQTAFIGDVILATALLEKIHLHIPKAKIDMLVRDGNQALLKEHPYLNELLVWNKKNSKYKSLFALLKQIRGNKYDAVINTQRFGATGMLTAFSGAPIKSGFKKNPFSMGFTHSAIHQIGDGTHEIERNQNLISFITNSVASKPKLYPSKKDYEVVEQYTLLPYITISPTSVWFTKQFPANKWAEFIDHVPTKFKIFLLGGPDDFEANNQIRSACKGNIPENLAGKLSFLQSAALMNTSAMNYVNDSGPLHLCSAMNAPVTAVFCSTVPSFGFTPLSDNQTIVETLTPLDCRPCGLHGHKACPLGHYNCANNIKPEQLMDTIA